MGKGTSHGKGVKEVREIRKKVMTEGDQEGQAGYNIKEVMKVSKRSNEKEDTRGKEERKVTHEATYI